MYLAHLVGHETIRYEARQRAAEREWRFLADHGLLLEERPAPRAEATGPNALRRLVRMLLAHLDPARLPA